MEIMYKLLNYSLSSPPQKKDCRDKVKWQFEKVTEPIINLIFPITWLILFFKFSPKNSTLQKAIELGTWSTEMCLPDGETTGQDECKQLYGISGSNLAPWYIPETIINWKVYLLPQ